jgi:hypothetical protein
MPRTSSSPPSAKISASSSPGFCCGPLTELLRRRHFTTLASQRSAPAYVFNEGERSGSLAPPPPKPMGKQALHAYYFLIFGFSAKGSGYDIVMNKLNFLQPVDLPERCFLQEVLYWVAFGRLPVAFDMSFGLGDDLRDMQDIGTYEVQIFDRTLSEGETARAGIPTDPYWKWQTASLSADRDPGDESSCGDVAAQERTRKDWLPKYEQAIVQPAAKIAKALMDGSLRAKGRLLPGANVDDARPIIEANGGTIFDIELTDIPPTFWNLKGIDFDASAAGSETEYYCHISCLSDDVISLFPPQGEEITGVRKIGKSFILCGEPSTLRPGSSRGRPPYRWDLLHLEVTALLLQGELPAKKEAAIQHFKSLFFEKHHISPGRTAIGEKLKPYYDRFMKNGD